MRNLREMLRDEDYKGVWEAYMGFLDLSLDEFMDIQERLLLEQIHLLKKCKLGKKILGKPKTKEIAKNMLRNLSNSNIIAYSGVAIINTKKNSKIIECVKTRILFNKIKN